ncbi:hypothetical protein A2U01_0080822, partial [Trifolium medium]|nr:hypothetical protein [Trifolium medium]
IGGCVVDPDVADAADDVADAVGEWLHRTINLIIVLERHLKSVAQCGDDEGVAN